MNYQKPVWANNSFIAYTADSPTDNVDLVGVSSVEKWLDLQRAFNLEKDVTRPIYSWGEFGLKGAIAMSDHRRLLAVDNDQFNYMHFAGSDWYCFVLLKTSEHANEEEIFRSTNLTGAGIIVKLFGSQHATKAGFLRFEIYDVDGNLEDSIESTVSLINDYETTVIGFGYSSSRGYHCVFSLKNNGTWTFQEKIRAGVFSLGDSEIMMNCFDLDGTSSLKMIGALKVDKEDYNGTDLFNQSELMMQDFDKSYV